MSGTGQSTYMYYRQQRSIPVLFIVIEVALKKYLHRSVKTITTFIQCSCIFLLTSISVMVSRPLHDDAKLSTRSGVLHKKRRFWGVARGGGGCGGGGGGCGRCGYSGMRDDSGGHPREKGRETENPDTFTPLPERREKCRACLKKRQKSPGLLLSENDVTAIRHLMG